MKKVNVTRSDWLLLIIGVAEGKEFTPVQLQKSAFLIGEELGISTKGYYKFKPYDYGPFANEVYQDAEDLANRGLVTIGFANNQRWKTYSITEAGKMAADQVASGLEPTMLAAVEEKVTWVLSKDFRELVLAIYEKYPKYRANSVFR